jgi:hypothetical protein
MNHHIATRRVRAGQPPCNFGTGCTASPSCADHDCQNHPVNTDLLGLPVIDTKFLDEQIKPKELPIEMIEPTTPVWRTVASVIASFLAAALIVSYFFSTM